MTSCTGAVLQLPRSASFPVSTCSTPGTTSITCKGTQPPAPALAEAELEHEYMLDIDASDEEEDATLAAHTLATIAGVLLVQHCRECASDMAIACASLIQHTR